jgi:glucokinase
MQQMFGLKFLEVVNDFTALAMAVPHLPQKYVDQIGSGTPLTNHPISVLGPGTGLGVSGLLWSGKHWVALAGEGGHVAFAPGNELEITLLHYARKHYDYVEPESFLCGPGLAFLHKALSEIDGRKPEELKPDDITNKAIEGDDHCRKTINFFCGMLGSFAGDQALTLGARGGVYIGGGIAPKLDHLLSQSPFRQRFEEKGRFREMVSPIPTYVMLSHSQVALIGAAAILANKTEQVLP